MVNPQGGWPGGHTPNRQMAMARQHTCLGQQPQQQVGYITQTAPKFRQYLWQQLQRVLQQARTALAHGKRNTQIDIAMVLTLGSSSSASCSRCWLSFSMTWMNCTRINREGGDETGGKLAVVQHDVDELHTDKQVRREAWMRETGAWDEEGRRGMRQRREGSWLSFGITWMNCTQTCYKKGGVG